MAVQNRRHVPTPTAQSPPRGPAPSSLRRAQGLRRLAPQQGWVCAPPELPNLVSILGNRSLGRQRELRETLKGRRGRPENVSSPRRAPSPEAYEGEKTPVETK